MGAPLWYVVCIIALTVVGLVFAVLICIDFARLSRGGWRRDELGRFLMALPAVLGAVFALVLAGRLIGDTLVRQIANLLTYAALVSLMPWMHRLMRLSFHGPSKMDGDMGGVRNMWKKARKAFVAGLVAGVSAGVGMYGKVSADGVTLEEAGAIAGAFVSAAIVAGFATYWTKNQPEPRPSTQDSGTARRW